MLEIFLGIFIAFACFCIEDALDKRDTKRRIEKHKRMIIKMFKGENE